VKAARRLSVAADPAPEFLPYGRQSIDESDIEAVADVLRSDYLTTGPAVDAFESAFAKAVAAPHAIACANGTAALHLAMMALNVGPGDAVIVPTITFLATANCARYCGADVIFADVDPKTALMTPATLRDAIARANGREIKAVLPVHLGGAPCATAEIAAMAKEIGAVLVEDACHALGTITAHGPIGACAHSAMTVFSLHAVKTIAAGEGGMITTQDPALAKRLKRLRNHGAVRETDDFVDAGFSCEAGAPAPWAYEMQALGYNYRLNDIQAALGRSQLSKLEAFAARRLAIATLYAPVLADMGLDFVRMPATACPHLFIALLDFTRTPRSEVMRRLRARGIGSQVHYMPVHRQPYYKALYGEAHLPGAETYYARCLSLPLYASMSAQDVFRVEEALSEALR
jgi:UDP-4-amino-4,6-dideoxy-N-acetyl-beta-L-altrosamine transaminase